MPPSVQSNGSNFVDPGTSSIQVPEPSRVPPPFMAPEIQAAEIVRRLSQPALVPLMTPMGASLLPASTVNVPPSPDRIELKEKIFNTLELDPPSPGRLVLKVTILIRVFLQSEIQGEIQEDPSPSEMNKRRKSLTKLNLDLEEMAKLEEKSKKSSQSGKYQYVM